MATPLTMAQILLILGASIMGVLGSLHLAYTFFSNKFDPYNSEIKSELEKTTLIISKNALFWNAWVGFNASHSIGAILVALFYIPLASQYNFMLQNSTWFTLLPIVIGLSYLYLAKRYWFIIPTVGMSIATLCFVVSGYLYNFT